MNKREIILAEAKRLFGQYGYLGFTLKQLAQACDMTSPALYYFYSSKADLFRDCLLSELHSRRCVLERCGEKTNTLLEFARSFAYEAIEVCEASHFRAVRAMDEIIHLPAEMQDEVRAAWEELMIAPVLRFLDRIIPNAPSRRLLATFLVNMATFSAAQITTYSREELAVLFESVARGIQETYEPARPSTLTA